MPALAGSHLQQQYSIPWSVLWMQQRLEHTCTHKWMLHESAEWLYLGDHVNALVKIHACYILLHGKFHLSGWLLLIIIIYRNYSGVYTGELILCVMYNLYWMHVGCFTFNDLWCREYILGIYVYGKLANELYHSRMQQMSIAREDEIYF